MYEQNVTGNQELKTFYNRQYIKEFLARPFTLITAILLIFAEISELSLSFLMWLSQFIIPLDEINLYLKDVLGTDSIEFSGGNFNLSAPIGSVALIAAFLILYFRSRNKDYSSAPTAGTVILKVYSTINLISQAIGSVLLLIIPFLVGFLMKAIQENFASHSAGLPDRVIGVSVFLITLYILFNIALNILNALGLRNFSNSLHSSLTTDKLSHKGTTLFAVTSFIHLGNLALTTLSSALILFSASENLSAITGGELSVIFEQVPFKAIGLLILLALPVSALKSIMLCLFALRYRKHITTSDNESYSLPVSGTPCTETKEVITPEETPATEVTEKENTEATEAAPNFCFMCGNPVDGEQNFCSHCGSKLTQ